MTDPPDQSVSSTVDLAVLLTTVQAGSSRVGELAARCHAIEEKLSDLTALNAVCTALDKRMSVLETRIAVIIAIVAIIATATVTSLTTHIIDDVHDGTKHEQQQPRHDAYGDPPNGTANNTSRSGQTFVLPG